MSIFAHIYHFKVKEQHLDTFGHVNNATYLELFEEARWDWITGNGYGLDVIKATGLGPVVLEISITFKRELRLRQDITVNTEISQTRGKISKLRQEMRDATGNLCCEAIFSFGLFDTNKRKLVPPTQEWLAAIGPSK